MVLLSIACNHCFFVELVVNLALSLLQRNDVLFVLNPNQRLLEPLAVLLYLPLLLEVELVDLLGFSLIADIVSARVEYDVFFSEQVSPLWPEN